MTTYKVKKVMVTMMSMYRWYLISKEQMESYCKGQETKKESVNDDLEFLFHDLQLGSKPPKPFHMSVHMSVHGVIEQQSQLKTHNGNLLGKRCL